MARRDTYNYTFRVGRKVSHRGITKDPARRQREHRRVRPGGKLTVDGRAKTRAGALRSERRRTRTRGYSADRNSTHRARTTPNCPRIFVSISKVTGRSDQLEFVCRASSELSHLVVRGRAPLAPCNLIALDGRRSAAIPVPWRCSQRSAKAHWLSLLSHPALLPLHSSSESKSARLRGWHTTDVSTAGVRRMPLSPP